LNEPPRLSIEDAAHFVANSFTREYQRACVEFWRKLHGDQYADAVTKRAYEIIKKRGKK
jgi:hypothetical protein